MPKLSCDICGGLSEGANPEDINFERQRNQKQKRRTKQTMKSKSAKGKNRVKPQGGLGVLDLFGHFIRYSSNLSYSEHKNVCHCMYNTSHKFYIKRM